MAYDGFTNEGLDPSEIGPAQTVFTTSNPNRFRPRPGTKVQKPAPEVQRLQAIENEVYRRLQSRPDRTNSGTVRDASGTPIRNTPTTVSTYKYQPRTSGRSTVTRKRASIKPPAFSPWTKPSAKPVVTATVTSTEGPITEIVDDGQDQSWIRDMLVNIQEDVSGVYGYVNEVGEGIVDWAGDAFDQVSSRLGGVTDMSTDVTGNIGNVTELGGDQSSLWGIFLQLIQQFFGFTPEGV